VNIQNYFIKIKKNLNLYRFGVLETQKSNGIADMGSVKPELGKSQKTGFNY
jgi:hypothetical protein